MSKTVAQLTQDPSLDGTELIVVYDGALAAPFTRQSTTAEVAALNDVAIAAALAAGTNAGVAAATAQTTADDAQTDATQALNDAAQGIADAGVAQTTADAAQVDATAALAGVTALQAVVLQGNGWDAATNTPVLTDGTGAANQGYIVNVGASRDLGSGSKTWTAGTVMYWAAGVWNPGPSVSSGVTSVNGQAGVVVLTADNIAATATNKYLTANWFNGLAAAGTAITGANRVVDQATLTAAILAAAQLTPAQLAAVNAAQGALSSVNSLVSEQRLAAALSGFSVIASGNGQYYVQAQQKNGVVAGTGVLRTLASLGYSSTTANQAWPLTASLRGSIDVNLTSYDNVVWQEALFDAFLANRWRNLSTYDNTAFILTGDSIIIPNAKQTPTNNTDSQQFSIDFNNALYYDQANLARPTFLKQPLNQTDADNNCIDNRFELKNGKFRGSSTASGAIGMKIGATRSGYFSRMEFQNYDVGFQAGFCLSATYQNINSVGCNVGVKVDKGWWSGSGYAVSGNQCHFYNPRFRMTSNTQIGLQLYGVDSSTVDGAVFEGTNSLIGLDIDNMSSTVSKNTSIRDLHIEMGAAGFFANSIIRYVGREYGTLTIDTLFNQSTVANQTLLSATNSQGTTAYNLQNIRTNSGSATWKLENINTSGAGSYRMRNVALQGAPQSAADVIDTVGFPNIWKAGSNVPPVGRIDFIKALT